jgi:hypothetical protein
MRERGYADFEASAPSGGDESASAVFGDFGLQSLDHARELGYHQTGDGGVVTADGAEADEGPMVLGENGEFPQDVQDQVDCLDAALARLDEGASWSEQDLGQYERLMSTALDNARSSAELAQAVDAWSGCMADRGFSYDEPTDPTTAAWPLDVSDAEKQTAVADVECKQEVELLGVWVQAFADAQRDLIETYRPTLEAMLERDLSRLAVAQEVLATTG